MLTHGSGTVHKVINIYGGICPVSGVIVTVAHSQSLLVNHVQS